MAERKSQDRPKSSSARQGKSAGTSRNSGDDRNKPAARKPANTRRKKAEPEVQSLIGRLGDLADTALELATRTAGPGALKLSKALLSKSPESIKAMQEAGRSLRDLREVAGLTQKELGDALETADESLIEAVEDGTATLSFELILRLAAVLARHDPIPFIIRFTRTYRPELWKVMDDWGLGRMPLQFERERHFINIYRRHDAARKLSDEGFDKVLQFTRSAFEAALHFAAEAEGVSDQIRDPEASTHGAADTGPADGGARSR